METFEIDTSTQVQAAKAAIKAKRKAKGCVDGWKGEETDSSVTFFSPAMVYLTGAGGLGIAIVAIVVAAGGLTLDIVGAFLCFFAPYMVYQKVRILSLRLKVEDDGLLILFTNVPYNIQHVSKMFRLYSSIYIIYFLQKCLSKLGTFRSGLNELRSKINSMMIENDKLSANVDRLKGSVDELEKVENDLCKIADASSVDRMVDIVSETRKINEKLKKNTEAAITQQLISTVLRNDRNDDLSLGPGELKDLMASLEANKSFKFKKFRFIQLLGSTRNNDVPVGKIMEVIRNLKEEKEPSKRIFAIM